MAFVRLWSRQRPQGRNVLGVFKKIEKELLRLEGTEQLEWKGVRAQREPWWECSDVFFSVWEASGGQRSTTVLQKTPPLLRGVGLKKEFWEVLSHVPSTAQC